MFHLQAAPKAFALGLLHGPANWFDTSEILWDAAGQVQRAASRALPKVHGLTDAEFRAVLTTGQRPASTDSETLPKRRYPKVARRHYITSETTRVAAMLRAMSVEADLKGGYYTNQLIDKGHVTLIDSKVSHGLCEMARAIGVPLSPAEATHLDRLHLMLTRGRYPAAWRKEKGALTYYIGIGTAPDAEATLRSKIRQHAMKMYAAYDATCQGALPRSNT